MAYTTYDRIHIKLIKQMCDVLNVMHTFSAFQRQITDHQIWRFTLKTAVASFLSGFTLTDVSR